MRFIILILLLCSSACGQEWRFYVEPMKPETQAVEPATPHDPDYYLVLFTARWCQPCQAFKNSAAFVRIKSRFSMTVVDVDDAPQWKKHVKSLPTVWLVRRSDRKMLRSWVGAVEVDSLLTAVAAIRKEAARKTPAVMQRTPAEHAAAKHLIDVHGINADGMTMQQMEAAHDAAHGGS